MIYENTILGKMGRKSPLKAIDAGGVWIFKRIIKAKVTSV